MGVGLFAFAVDLSRQFQLVATETDPIARVRDRPWLCVAKSAAEATNLDETTTALLQISYDGSRFSGWSAANDDRRPNATSSGSSQLLGGRRRRRGRGPASVRSVEGVLKSNLAKIYGNVDPQRIVVEGCSRTDKGVHARFLVAQFYCLTAEVFNELQGMGSEEDSTSTHCQYTSSVPGKRLPHPQNATDSTCFVPVPKSLTRLSFALNRMCYDMRIMAVAPTPSSCVPSYRHQTPQKLHSTSSRTKAYLPFHPTLAATNKTYQYNLSFGLHHDPISRRSVWHTGAEELQLDRMKIGASILEGTHNFAAFQGAPTSTSDKRKRMLQSTTCTIHSIGIHVTSQWVNPVTLAITVTGDRFLYKMVRFLVGALVTLGRPSAKFDESNLRDTLDSGIRPNNAFSCAPAKALVLHNVEFDTHIDWQTAQS